MLLVPCDPLRPRRPDPHLAGEWAAARDLGSDVGLVDHDVLQRATDAGQAGEAVLGVAPAADAVYRAGW
jgi:hypothetical protein